MDANNKSPIKIGQIVRHRNKYGIGRVVKYVVKGNNQYIDVEFDAGLRTFVFPDAFEKEYLQMVGVSNYKPLAFVKPQVSTVNTSAVKPVMSAQKPNLTSTQTPVSGTNTIMNMATAKAELSRQYLVSDGWIYSIYDYFPSRHVYTNDKAEYRRLSLEVLQYKEGDDEAVERFTLELYWAVEKIIDVCKPKGPVWLIGVPSSQVETGSQAEQSIIQICDAFNKYSTDVSVVNKTSCLKRVQSIPKAHLSVVRPSVDMQLASLSFNCSDIPNNVLVILIDDIVTLGTTMKACRYVVGKAGIPADSIIGLTICKTASDGIAKGLV